MPSLNSRIPCPRPFINSGILRPPNRITTITRISNRCIGLNSMKTPPSPDPGKDAGNSYGWRPVRIRNRSKYNTFIAHTPRDSFAVQELEQGNRVLAADARKLFESSNLQAFSVLLLVICQQAF